MSPSDLEALGLERGQKLPSETTIRRALHTDAMAHPNEHRRMDHWPRWPIFLKVKGNQQRLHQNLKALRLGRTSRSSLGPSAPATIKCTAPSKPSTHLPGLTFPQPPK